MAIDRDALFVDTFVKALTNTIALDLSAASAFKIAMYTNSVVPDFSQTNPAYGVAPWDTAEVDGTGYTAGGTTLAVVSFAELASTGKTGWKFDPASWADSTITDAEGGLIYAPGLSDRCVLFRRFGQSYSTQDGLFEITFHADGAWRQNLLGATS
ncbi:hypothetical protein ACIBCT_21255 [Streptosporangium sp. NPDC050855]|uniref:hypothetical protein n=1 Tax=Streptosporangium sp. NPDC050855 TaxID=3366194 RepID=UPI00378F6856